MDLDAIRAQLDLERRTLQRHGECLEQAGPVTRVAFSTGEHSILFSAMDPSQIDAIIRREQAHYRAKRSEVEWKWYAHDQPSDLLDRLLAHGFRAGPVENVMVFDLAHLDAWESARPAHDVREVATVHDIDLYRQAAEAAFHSNHAARALELRKALQGGSREQLAFIGLEGETPVSVGRLYTHPRSLFGGLYGGGTIPSRRKMGWYRADVAARARAARELGARYLLVDALQTSRPILEKLGFEILTQTRPCLWSPRLKEMGFAGAPVRLAEKTP